MNIEQVLESLAAAVLRGDWQAIGRFSHEAEELGESRYTISQTRKAAMKTVMISAMSNDADIDVVLLGIEYAIHIDEQTDARNIGEAFVNRIEAAGGKAYLNPFWYGVDRDANTIEAPGARHGSRHFEYIKWPASASGDIVTIDDLSYKVIVNYVSPGMAGKWAYQFSLWAVMPA